MPEIVHLDRADLSHAAVVALPDTPLSAEAVRLRVERFAITANNMTYAVIGDAFGYWSFFPAPPGKGVVPMWGHARVEASNHPEIAVGERVYGYLPMGTHLDVVPGQISAGQFTDMTAHRQPMSGFYNVYSRLGADPEHDPAHEGERMVYGPLFKTGFLIEAMGRREGWFGAEQLLITSASSKTALALASVAKEKSPDVRRIGLTSPANLAFVRATKLYDNVFTYDAIGELPSLPTLSVDFAGNSSVLRAIHTHLGRTLVYSMLVGATHIDNRAPADAALPGPEPKLFFAPTEAVSIIKALGPQGFAQAVGVSWRNFLGEIGGVVALREDQGLEAAIQTFTAIAQGTADPAIGQIISV